jgi:hypothetical protein
MSDTCGAVHNVLGGVAGEKVAVRRSPQDRDEAADALLQLAAMKLPSDASSSSENCGSSGERRRFRQK